MGNAEQERWREKLLTHREHVRALARRLVLDPDRADDVAQDALLAALEAPATPRPGRLRAWLSAIVRNLAWRVLRDDERRRRRESARARPNRAPATADAVADLQIHREVVDAVLSLEEPYRTTLVMHFFEGLPPRAIAERRGLRGATVRSHLHRGIERLRTQLDERHGDRRIWTLALLPLAFPSRTTAALAGAAASTAGGIVMSIKAKLAVVALLLFALGAVTVTVALRGRGLHPSERVHTSGARGERLTNATSAPEQATEPGGAATDAVQAHIRVLDPGGAPAEGAIVRAYARPRREILPGLATYSNVPWFQRDWRPALGHEPVVAERVTDHDGRADLDLTEGHAYRLEARKAGYAPAETVRDYLAQSTSTLELRLAQAHPLAGRVVDAKGAPVSGAIVAVGEAGLAANGGLIELPHTVVADSEGHYRFDDIPSGGRSLWAAFPGGMPVFVATIRVPDIERFDVVLARGAVLTGRVTAKGTGRPLPGIEVRARHDGSPDTFGCDVTDGDGVYRIDTLPPGRVTGLHAAGPGYAQEPMEPNARVVLPLLPGDRVVYDLELVATGTMTGTVRGPDGPLEDVMIEAMYRTQSEYPTFLTRTDAAGVYRLEDLPAARYLVRAAHAGYVHDAARVNLFEAFEPANAGLLVEVESAKGTEYAIALRRPGGATIEGRVVDETGAPLPGAEVAAAGTKGVAGADGSFRLEGCVPGDSVFLSATLDGYRRDDLVTVALAANATVRDCIVRMRRTVDRELVGRVLTRNGTVPLAASVFVTTHEEQRPRYRAPPTRTRYPVGPDGTFRVKLRDGFSRLQAVVVQAAVPGGSPSESVRVPITDEARYEVELVLPELHNVRGIVLGEDGQPVAGACVSLRPEGEQPEFRNFSLHPHALATVLAVTGPDGLFEATGFGPGRYELRTWARAHIDAYVGVVVPAPEPVRVMLEPSLEIAGRVLTTDGDPVGGTSLYVQRQRNTKGNVIGPEETKEYFRYGQLRNLWTNAQGAFRLSGLKRGAYRINVGGYRGGPNVVRTVFEDVTAGSTDVKLVLQPGLSIRGRVVGASGEGLASVYVLARREAATGADTRRSAITAPDGTFCVTGLAAGAHTLRVSVRQGRATRQVTRENIPAGTEDLRIEVNNTFLSISGELRDADGKPMGGVGLRIQQGRRWSQNTAVTDARGRFVFEGLDAATYRIVLNDPRHENALLGGGDDVQAGTEDVVLELDTGATLEGVVRDVDGAPIAGAGIYANVGDISRTTRTGENGRFRVVGLPEGARLEVWCTHRRYATWIRRDVVAGSGDLAVTLRRGLPTTGRVTNAAGRPLGGMHLRFDPTDGGDTMASATADQDGRFSVDLLDGEYAATGKRIEDGEYRQYGCGTIRGGKKGVVLTATRKEDPERTK